MKVLVTGGAGFIGSFLVDKLINNGHDVTIFDNLEPQVHNGKIPPYLNNKATFVKGDIRNYEEIKSAVTNIDIIYHYAASVGVGQSMYQIKDYVNTNELGTANLLHVLANEPHKVKKVIVASSMSIYGEGSYYCEKCRKEFHNIERTFEQLKRHTWELICPDCSSVLKAVATNESKVLGSRSVYAINKKTQEQLTLNVCKAYNIPAVALRFFNTYGPRQSLSNPYTGVAAIFISRIKNNNSPIIFEDGAQARDFVSVHDVVQASILVMNKDEANYETFNVGSGEKITIMQVANTLIKILSSKVTPTINNEFRKGDIRHCYADISKIKEIGYVPKISFEQGMVELVEWSKTQGAKDMVNKAYNELKDKKLV